MKFYSIFLLSCLFLTGCTSVNSSTASSAANPWKPSHGATKTISQPSIGNYPQQSATHLIGLIDLDLAVLMDIAFENSPETRRMWQLSRVAAAQVGEARSAFYPTASVNVGPERTRYDNPALSSKFGSTGNLKYYSTFYAYPSLQLNYTLFSFGANMANARAAQQNLYAANFQYNRALQTLLYQVQSRYFALSATEASVDANRESLKDATETFKMTEIRLESGLGNRQDYLQAKANMLQAKFRLEDSIAKMEQARSALALTIGVRVSEQFKIVRSRLPENLQTLSTTTENLITQTLKSRPDILAYYSQMKAATEKEKYAKRNLLPKIVLTGEGEYGRYNHIGTATNYTLFGGLSWDIFTGFNKYYQMLEQRARRGVAKEALRSAELQAVNDVWSQYYTYQSAVQQVTSARALLTASNEAFKATEIGYKNGLNNFVDLLNAQNVLASARQNLIAAENTLSTALAGLAYATGGMDLYTSK